MADTVPFAVAVGKRLREIRDAYGITADQLAAKARSVGFKWQRSTVTRIELGQRALAVEEFMLLPTLLKWTIAPLDEETRRAAKAALNFTDEFSLWEMIPADTEVALSEGAVATRGGIEHVLAGEGAWVASGGWRFPLIDERAAESRDQSNALYSAAANEAEQKAARRLQRSPFEVAEASFRRWHGRSLTDERDRRLTNEGAGEGRGQRGQMTRVLMEELAEELALMDEEHKKAIKRQRSNRKGK